MEYLPLDESSRVGSAPGRIVPGRGQNSQPGVIISRGLPGDSVPGDYRVGSRAILPGDSVRGNSAIRFCPGALLPILSGVRAADIESRESRAENLAGLRSRAGGLESRRSAVEVEVESNQPGARGRGRENAITPVARANGPNHTHAAT